MNIFEDTNPHPLKELLAEIYNRTAVLPDFQRDFVWDPSATQELIVSIANNYPAGSLLRVRDTHRVFAAREFEGAPKLDGHKHTHLVLDGQQRLTSLYQAFYGVGDHRYYLDLRVLIDGGDFEDAIFHLRANHRRVPRYESLEYQAEALTIPLSMIKNGTGAFTRWIMQITPSWPDEQRIQLQDTLMEVYDNWIQVIDDYQFPVVTLSDKTSPAALCTIFETLNRTGVKLSVFELLTARFWPSNIRLRDLWEKAQIDFSIIGDFEIDPYYILQAIALINRRVPSCKRSDVLNLAPTDITKWWQPMVEALAFGLSILRDDCKVMQPKWLPYQTMLVPLAAVLAKSGILKTPEAGVRREKLKRWFWCSVYRQTYDNASNSQAAKDVGELLAWFESDAAPETVTTFRFDPNMLREVTPRQRSIYRGTICLILGTGTGARDFHTQAVITGNLMMQEGIDDHHIFPNGFLLHKKGITSTQVRDCVLNRTLIDRTTNQMISDRAPSQYLEDIRTTPGFPFNAVLSSHCLPTSDDSPLWIDDYDAFLTWRQDRLWQEIRRVTGLAEVVDVATDEAELA